MLPRINTSFCWFDKNTHQQPPAKTNHPFSGALAVSFRGGSAFFCCLKIHTNIYWSYLQVMIFTSSCKITILPLLCVNDFTPQFLFQEDVSIWPIQSGGKEPHIQQNHQPRPKERSLLVLFVVVSVAVLAASLVAGGEVEWTKPWLFRLGFSGGKNYPLL